VFAECCVCADLDAVDEYHVGEINVISSKPPNSRLPKKSKLPTKASLLPKLATSVSFIVHLAITHVMLSELIL